MTVTKPASKRPNLKPWPVAVAIVLALAAVGIVVVASSDSESASGGVTPVSHVHGLGINPADGDLYAATHFGVFRMPGNGEAELVSVPRDTMGFTVVARDHFLGSGHPAFQDDPLFERGTPPLLGLIESTDGGRTWKPRSLFGEVDFHALEAAHGLIYGFDATSARFLVSDDGEEWEVRAADVAMSDFAVNPEDADHVVATTDAGLSESTDGGRSWRPLDGPNVVFLSWNGDGALWGVDGEGRTFVFDGSSWDERGRLPGPPQALLATKGQLYAAATTDDGTAIYTSDNGGRWDVRYVDR